MQCGNAYQEDDVYDERQLNYWDRVQMITMNTSREGVREGGSEGGSEGVREGVSFDKSNLSLAAWIGARSRASQVREPMHKNPIFEGALSRTFTILSGLVENL